MGHRHNRFAIQDAVQVLLQSITEAARDERDADKLLTLAQAFALAAANDVREEVEVAGPAPRYRG